MEEWTAIQKKYKVIGHRMGDSSWIVDDLASIWVEPTVIESIPSFFFVSKLHTCKAGTKEM